MKIEQAKQMLEESLERLAEELERGGSETLARFLDALSKFHRYSFGNVMLILTQRPTATRVAGFHTWRKLGRFVKKGEKGIVILAPMTLKKREDKNGETDGEDRDDEKTYLAFRAVHVFDLSQTDGEPLPEPATVTGDPGANTGRLKIFIAERGIAFDYADDLGTADGVSTGGKIRVRSGLAPAEEFSVLVHELAHELLHRTEDRTTLTRTVREVEAEAVAYAVCRAVGLETGTAASDYISTYNGDRKTLADSLTRIQQTAALILDALDPGE